MAYARDLEIAAHSPRRPVENDTRASTVGVAGKHDEHAKCRRVDRVELRTVQLDVPFGAGYDARHRRDELTTLFELETADYKELSCRHTRSSVEGATVARSQFKAVYETASAH
jgi:hypothetical protein